MNRQTRGADVATGIGLWKPAPEHPIPYGIPHASEVGNTLKTDGVLFSVSDSNPKRRMSDLIRSNF